MNSWLNELGPGDKVILRRSGHRSDSVAEVERTTKTMIVLSNGARYRKSDGRAVGAEPWNWSTLVQCTPERLLAMRANRERRQNLTRINAVSWHSVDPAMIAQILELLENAQ